MKASAEKVTHWTIDYSEEQSKVSKVNSVYISLAVSNNLVSPLRETHMPYGIIVLGYLPPGRGEIPAFTRSRSRFSI